MAIEKGDPVSVSKVLIEFSKEHVKLKLKAGLLGGKVLTPEDIKSLASLLLKRGVNSHALRNDERSDLEFRKGSFGCAQKPGLCLGSDKKTKKIAVSG